MGLQPFFENRMVYFLKGQTSQLESEMYTFPRGVTVDILDALAWQVDFNLAQLVSHTSFDQDVEEHASNMVTFSFDEIMAACGLGATQTTFFSRQR